MMPNIRSKNVYEAVMLKQRIAEERKEHQRTENRKFFQESDVRARREKQWTSDKAYNHSLMAYMQPDKETILAKLDFRRNKLRELLRVEADLYETVLSQPPDTRDSTYARLRGQLEDILRQKEEYRVKQADALMQRQITENDPEIRERGRARDRLEDVKIWDEQAQRKMQAREREMREIAEEAERLRREAEAFEQSEKDNAREKRGQARAYGDSLKEQMEEVKQREAEENELDLMRREIIEEQERLQALAGERLAEEDARMQRRHGKALLRQHAASLRRRSQQVQAELAKDVEWLTSLANLEMEEQKEAIRADEEDRAQMLAVRTMLEEDMRREISRAADIDEIFASEAAELWKKREQEWQREEDARSRLLKEVLATRQEQLESRLKAIQQVQEERAVEREDILRAIANAKQAEVRSPQRKQVSFADGDFMEGEEKTADSKTDVERRAEAAYEAALRDEAAKLNLTVDQVKAAAAGATLNSAQPMPSHRRRTQLW